MSTRVSRLVLVLVACSLSDCQCGASQLGSCEKPTDCPGDEVCVNKVCQPSSDGGTDGGASSDAGSSDGGAHDAGVGKCGDGALNLGESCDDGNVVAGDGCTAHCVLEPGFLCPTPGQACVSSAVCGDGRLGGQEACDDQNLMSGDGCSSTCTLESGWVCPTVGIACVAAKCGDGIIAGLEECDDHNSAPGDGCSASCVIEDGYDCTGGTCVKTTCGNAVREGNEQCDDGNHDLGDGCDVFCHTEPKCTNGTCVAVCGDGVKAASEACDDGNTRAGDGCSPTCTVEHGFSCADAAPASAKSIDIPIVYRDFIPHTQSGGHIDFNNLNVSESGIVGTVNVATLGSDGKPVYASSGSTASTHGATFFNQWYRDVVGTNRTVVDHLTVDQTDAGSYVFLSDDFFPLDGRGWQSDHTETSLGPADDNKLHNFSFTSELRYWFTYAGGESLTFVGDDDVWVFINKRLAVDLGGVHGPATGNITLDAAAASTFSLTKGKVYEAVVFQAERHVNGSNYHLTLLGFNAQKSTCQSICGDGIVTRYEVCDDGKNDGSYGGCMPGCLARGPYCGDAKVQADAGELCDDGTNTGTYGSCAPGCKSTRRCGDGLLQTADGEECDDGNNTSGDGCDATCHAEIN